MFAVALHELGRNKTQFGKQPGKYGNLKDNAHRQVHHEQGPHIGIQGYHIVHFRADLISTQKTESQRENQKITDTYAYHEHQITASYNPHGILAFLGIKPGETKQYNK